MTATDARTPVPPGSGAAAAPEGPGTEPVPAGLGLTHEVGTSLRVTYFGRPLTRYVYRPWDDQLESPRPYFHPMRTLGGDPVSIYRPHDHIWHKGLALSLPNVDADNFWGGVTYRRGTGYRQYDNNGSMDHLDFPRLELDGGRLHVTERLRWHTQQGRHRFTEERRIAVAVLEEHDAWALVFRTALTNVGADRAIIGSPTTEGRDNAGYGGLFWRGPRSFTGGTVHVPGRTGGDDLMGVRAPWLGFTGRHDGHGRSSTLAFVDAAGNEPGGAHVKWFVRSTPFAAVCPAPFFDREVTVEGGGTLTRTYAVVVADGDRGPSGTEVLAHAGTVLTAEVFGETP
ncbi:MAG: PmoA family protein [Streptomyces sp.]|nr:PmoA family protein [Streptomyces sp.]NUS12729.1 PmoA family protein [Streptomyces sp.]